MRVIASLNAMFRLYDGYSTTADKVIKKTDLATNKILSASGATDKFNNKLEATGASAGKASSGLGRFVGIAATIVGAIKGMNIADTYTNTAARLNLINDGLQTQAQLQDKIFAAADRSKGSYASMADSVAKLQLNAGDQFKNNDEAIAFTELLQKSFKIGGASTSEKEAGTLQLTQAMGSGKLQGDEFRSIMENAPMVADAIAKYMGKSKGELKKLSSQGVITSDIIKNAMFMASDDINAKFADMPYTFADIWNKISNGAIKKFAPLITKINKMINSDDFMAFTDKLIAGFGLVADAVSWFIDVVVDGWDTIGPILALISGVYLVVMITRLWAMVPPLIAQAVAWLAIYWPILLVIAIIAIAIAAARQFGTSWEDIIGYVGGSIGVFAATFYNKFVYIWNVVAAFINFFGNVFRDPINSIKILFYDLLTNMLGNIETMAKGIEDLLNGIPGVTVDISSGITDLKDGITQKKEDLKDSSGYVTYAQSKEYQDLSEAYIKGSDLSKDLYGDISDKLKSLSDLMNGSQSDPTVVEGTGVNSTVQVDMSDEDIQYLRDIAERDYINKFSTATLAPKITVSFGDVHETADANKVAKKIQKILREQIAIAGEG